MSIRVNATLDKLRNGGTAFGSLSLIPEPSLAELVGDAGYDFFCADMEHAAADGRTIENMIRATEAVNMTPIVRVRHVEEKTFLWVLDSGAQGLIVPMLEDAATARRASDLMRYPPVGSRTLCTATRAAGRGAYRQDFPSYIKHINDQLLLVGLIESPEAAAQAAEIAKEAVDVFLVGRADISMKMGLHYAPQSSEVIDVTKRVLGQVIDAGKIAGVLAYDVDDARRWMEFGCRFIIYSQPELLLAAHYGKAIEEMKASGLTS